MPWSGIAYHDSNQLCLFPSSFWILPFTNRNHITSPSLSIGWQTRHTFFHFWIYSMLSLGSNCNRHSCNPCRERMPDIQGKVVLCDVWSFAKSASAESPKFQQDRFHPISCFGISDFMIFDELFFPPFFWMRFVICGTVRGIGLLGETLSTTLRVVGRPPFGSKPLTCRIHVAYMSHTCRT